MTGRRARMVRRLATQLPGTVWYRMPLTAYFGESDELYYPVEVHRERTRKAIRDAWKGTR